MFAEGSQKVVYEGSACRWRELHGAELTLQSAILDAYDLAMHGPNRDENLGSEGPERAFRVVGLFITGSNPPSDYKAQLVDHP
jgi:hypothetical protein